MHSAICFVVCHNSITKLLNCHIRSATCKFYDKAKPRGCHTRASVAQIAYLGLVGGSSEEDTIVRVLSATVGNMLARLYNWNGLKGKPAFKTLELCDVIYGNLCHYFCGLCGHLCCTVS